MEALTPLEALEYLDRIVARVSMSREEHHLALEARRTLAEALTERKTLPRPQPDPREATTPPE